MREAGEAARPVALARVEVVADRPDKAVLVPGDPGECAAEECVRLALAVDIRAEQGRDAVGTEQRFEALVVDRLAESA